MLKDKFWNITILYGLGEALTRAITFLLLAFHTNTELFNSVKEQDQLFVLYPFLAFMNALYAFGMHQSFFKYYNKNNATLGTALSAGLIIVIIISTGMFLTQNIINQFIFKFENPLVIHNQPWIMFVICILSLDAFSARLKALLRVLEKPIYFIMISLLNVISSFLLTYYFLEILKCGFSGVVIALFITSIIQFILLLPSLLYCKKNIFNFQIKLLYQMLKFGIPFLPAALLLLIIELSDRFFIHHLLPAGDVLTYSAGYKIGAIILIIVNAFNQNWQPYLNKQAGKNKIQHAINNFQKIGNVFIVFLITVASVLFLFWEELASLHIPFLQTPLIHSNYIQPNAEIVPIVMCAYILYGVFVLQMPSIYFKNKQNWVFVLWCLGGLVNIVGNIILISPQFMNLGIKGAAISTLAAYAVMTTLLLIKNYRWMKITYNYYLFVKILLLGGFLGVLKSVVVINTSALIVLSVLYILWTSAEMFKLYKQ